MLYARASAGVSTVSLVADRISRCAEQSFAPAAMVRPARSGAETSGVAYTPEFSSLHLALSRALEPRSRRRLRRRAFKLVALCACRLKLFTHLRIDAAQHVKDVLIQFNLLPGLLYLA